MSAAMGNVDQVVLALKEITPAQCDTAVGKSAAHALDRDDLIDLLDKIRPTPHTPSPSPARRRAEPRHTR